MLLHVRVCECTDAQVTTGCFAQLMYLPLLLLLLLVLVSVSQLQVNNITI